MALLLKKVWESVSNRSNSNSNVKLSESQLFQSSTGAFDKLPVDIFQQILRFLGPKDAAKASVVCKTWKFLVSDDRLWIYFLQNRKEPWETIVFAETNLRAGHTLGSYYNYDLHLSFMQIYARRAHLTGSVIIDGGSGYCKYGWSKYSAPSGRSATFLEFGNIESPMYSRLRHFFATIHSRMQVKPSSQPIVVSVPLCHSDDTESAKASRRQLKDAIYSVLFDMNVPAVCAIDQAVLSLYAARRTSGIVVNIGFHVTSIVPILRGKIMRSVGVETIGQGALRLTGYLREQMQQRGINFESLYTVRSLKENLCYVALDYEAELAKDTRASFEVPGEGVFTLSKERFLTGEILFRPQLGGMQAMGLHQAVALCMDHCHHAELATDDGWFKTVVLAGGTSCLPGLPERLEKELRGYVSPAFSDGIKVIPPPYGPDSAWFGAKLIANVSTFRDTWCINKKQFHQRSRRNSSFIGSW
ncbi:hypothetical protein H6P81_008813 [Aristolochia fimbriata]|uniref:F-box domain-containing protein n=1 Tax=Aristolochia fimbriata TaxID=158543 RepID=A0AAV7ENN0_ARIFI|nr:hypothetical protein H6P81_008813 [Aristolochia fimbriata]